MSFQEETGKKYGKEGIVSVEANIQKWYGDVIKGKYPGVLCHQNIKI